MEEGTFEEIAATSALVARTAKRLHKTADAISGKWIFEQAQDGNEVCIEKLTECVISLQREFPISVMC